MCPRSMRYVATMLLHSDDVAACSNIVNNNGNNDNNDINNNRTRQTELCSLQKKTSRLSCGFCSVAITYTIHAASARNGPQIPLGSQQLSRTAPARRMHEVALQKYVVARPSIIILSPGLKKHTGGNNCGRKLSFSCL